MDMVSLILPDGVTTEQVSDYDMRLWYGVLDVTEETVLCPAHPDLVEEYNELISSIPPIT